MILVLDLVLFRKLEHPINDFKCYSFLILTPINLKTLNNQKSQLLLIN